MAHIPLPDGVPGIIGPLMEYPETARPLSALTQTLLRGPSTLTEGERELIATYVSSRNNCFFCASSHGAAARHLLNDPELVRTVMTHPDKAEISEKLKALLAIAGKVQQSGRDVTEHDIERARKHGATDRELHDTVLIAAAFCMFNRYVDGLATLTPKDEAAYDAIGARLASVGYVAPA